MNKAEAIKEMTTLPSLNTIKEQIWKMLNDALAVTDGLISRGIKVDSICQVYEMDEGIDKPCSFRLHFR